MNTFPYSKLTAEARAEADRVNAMNEGRMMSFTKPVLPDFQRIAAGTFAEIDKMLAAGWLVIDRTH